MLEKWWQNNDLNHGIDQKYLIQNPDRSPEVHSSTIDVL